LLKSIPKLGAKEPGEGVDGEKETRGTAVTPHLPIPSTGRNEKVDMGMNGQIAFPHMENPHHANVSTQLTWGTLSIATPKTAPKQGLARSFALRLTKPFPFLTNPLDPVIIPLRCVGFPTTTHAS